MPSILSATWDIRCECEQIEQTCDQLDQLQKILEQKATGRPWDNLQKIFSDFQELTKIIRHSVEDIRDINDTIRRLYG